MEVRVFSDGLQVCHTAADIIVKGINKNPSMVLGLPTGNTPVEMYARLVKDYREGRVDFSSIRTCNLDEYVGLDEDHPQSYHSFMNEHFFGPAEIPRSHTHLPNGNALDLEGECRQYDARIAQMGGIDLMILGIGRNGHIGFNEPGADFESGTHVAQLAEETRFVNARHFGDLSRVPISAMTLGIRSILSSRKILVLAIGKEKAEPVHQMIRGPVTAHVPASALQNHMDVVCLLDTEAASLLPMSTSQRVSQ